MDLKDTLSQWIESPEDDDGDDYGLIIDHSLTENTLPPMPTLPADMPRLRTPPPAAAQLGQIPLPSAHLGLMSPPSTQLGLVPPSAQLGLLGHRVASPTARSILPQNLPLISPPGVSARRPSDQTFLAKYAEKDDGFDEDYNDLVSPSEAAQLDSHLAALKTPRRRIPSWPRNADELLSGTTAVSSSKPSSEKMMRLVSRPPPPQSTSSATMLGLGISAPASEKSAHRVPSVRQRVAEWQLKAKAEAQRLPQQQRRPMLIRNMSRGNEPVVIGCMRYDPVSRMWVGNDDEGTRISSAMAETDRKLRSRGLIRNEPPLDSRKLARKISARSAGSPRFDDVREDIEPKPRPVFDPQNLRWIDPNEHKGDPKYDPFWNIPDLPVNPVAAKMRARSRSDAVSMANVFSLTDEQRQAFAQESSEYEAFARRWFPNSTAA